ncbi:hypothetical protein NE237_001740 [Protea cynaroides]|uniref:C2H2-type domain-containing protein n=1 Tax=Protea cynaroides TaxID=273540 RepID=A0A9Q0QYR0_9MAGN|nr:hypothetical protein NE237_001740 [Protea cynaroides]
MGKSTTGMDDSAIAGDNENTTSTGEEEEEETKAKNPHRCKICSKAFRTGQALGGHQRLHRISPAEAAPPSSSEDMSKGTGRGILEFDLNELPEESMEDDDEVINSVTQHNASSSYNSVT